MALRSSGTDAQFLRNMHDSVLEENKYLPIETDEDDIDTLKYSNNKSQIWMYASDNPELAEKLKAYKELIGE